MTSKTTATVWPTLAVADLAAAHVLPEADAVLTEDIAAHGILEPLYVATTPAGALRVVDGMRRLAAAVALSLADVPVTHRPVIQVTALTAHPGNVRRDLAITAEFVKSIQVHGIRTPIQVTRTPDGQLRVVDGHRRLAAAIKAHLTHVPYLYEERAEAGQILDMVTTARHRTGLTKSEETAALFAAADLGADARQMAAAAAVTVSQAKKFKILAKSTAVRTAVTAADMSLEDYAILAELEATDPQAVTEAMTRIGHNPKSDHGWIVRQARTNSQVRMQLAKHRAKLEASGARIRTWDELRQGAVTVSSLGLTSTKHATCRGQVWVAQDHEYVPYCTNPKLYGHKTPDGATDQPKITASERRAIISGGQDWDTAEGIRREWLAEFFAKGRRSRAESDLMTTLTARVLMSGSHIISRHALHPKATNRLEQWFGIQEYSGREQCAEAVTPAKAAAMSFASVATAYEQHAARTVWRTDGAHAEADVRTTTGQYLTWLTQLGYTPTPIEQAVIDDQPYNPAAVNLAADEASGKTLN
ncbi:ParB N-terminal domain-containing protein [Streptomyces sp. NPDC096136]|uniref:ParB N-terminal domain-containing protein n=1 Tax=Streptomyces sp. NPDC096136 TaxID=3366076 RepID=UPI003809BFE9